MATPPVSGRTIDFDPSSLGLAGAIGDVVYDSGGVFAWRKYATGATSWLAIPVSNLVTADPSLSPGLKAPAGAMVYKTDGTLAWSKFGPNATDWQAFPGSAGLASVTATAPLSGAGTSGSPLALAAASGSVPGSLAAADFAKLATVPSGSFLQVCLFTSVIDFVAGGTGFTFNMGALPGFLFLPRSVNYVLRTKGGTLTTQPLVNIGNNGSHNNISAAAIAIQTALFALAVPAHQTANPVSPNVLVDLTTPIVVDVSTSAAGSSCVCTGQVYLQGMLIT